MEVDEKIREYENFIEDVLKPDLAELEKSLQQKSEQCKSWTEVKTSVKACRELKAKNVDMKVQLDLGNDITAFARVEQLEAQYVHVGCGCYLVMNCDEADKYADIRLKLLNNQIDHFRKLAVQVKVHIKMVLLAITELQASKASN